MKRLISIRIYGVHFCAGRDAALYFLNATC